jgi:hypothetical protein
VARAHAGGNSAQQPASPRLWRGQGKHAQARDLLAPVYFNTADLNDARALLEELA